MNSLFKEDIWKRTHDDCDGNIVLVTTIERFFCFRPLAFATRINHLFKNIDHTPNTSLWPSIAYIVIVYPPADAPTSDEFSHHYHGTYDNPLRFGAKRFINKPRIVRSVSTFQDAISWNPDNFDAYSNTNSYSAEIDWRNIIQIRIAIALVVLKGGGHL